jgi:hypothetical protein
LPPGATYVFRCGGAFEQFGDAQPLDLSHPVVVSGGTVAVIDLRSRAITVELGIPSATPPEQFVLSAEFRCQVTDGLAVARDGTADIVDNLRRYLMQDRDLTDIGRQFNSDELGEALVLVQDQVYARLTSSARGPSAQHRRNQREPPAPTDVELGRPTT